MGCRANIANMTRNEPGTSGDNQTESGEQAEAGAGETQRGNMIAAEDAADQKTRDERARAVDAGDKKARAEQTDAERAGMHDGKPSRVRNAAEWLDGKLVPKLGGADLGPYDEESEESVRSHDECPLCGHPMAEHTIDRSTASAVLNCPAPQRAAPESFEPLNEVGMVKRSGQGE